MLNCVLIDDEQQCLDLLSAMIKAKFAGRLSVLAASTDAALGVELIKTLSPQLLFLDVEIPGFNGLQLLSQFPQRDFSVVFTTAHDRYALEALKTEAVDYLLKPISLQELTIAIEKAEKLATLRQQAQGKTAQHTHKILLPAAKGSLLVDTKEILHIESDNNYSNVYFVQRPRIVVARTLKTFDDQLSAKGFFRIHQSHLINLAHLQSYQSGEPGHAVLRDGTRLEIARRRRVLFLKAIGNL